MKGSRASGCARRTEFEYADSAAPARRERAGSPRPSTAECSFNPPVFRGVKTRAERSIPFGRRPSGFVKRHADAKISAARDGCAVNARARDSARPSARRDEKISALRRIDDLKRSRRTRRGQDVLRLRRRGRGRAEQLRAALREHARARLLIDRQRADPSMVLSSRFDEILHDTSRSPLRREASTTTLRRAPFSQLLTHFSRIAS